MQNYWAAHGGRVSSVQTGAPYPIDGYACIANKTDCIGDNHDAAYLSIDKPPFPLKDNNTGGAFKACGVATALPCRHACFTLL